MTSEEKRELDGWMRKARDNDDEEAFGKVDSILRPYLFNFCTKLFGSNCKREDIEESINDTLLTLWKDKDQWEDHCCAWATHIAKNKAIDRQRQLKKYHGLVSTDDPTTDEPATANFTDASDMSIAEKQLFECIYRKLLDRTDETTIEIFRLSFQSKLSLENIAVVLNLNVNTVKSRFKREKNTIRQVFEECQ